MSGTIPSAIQDDPADHSLLNYQITRAYRALLIGFERWVGITPARYRVLFLFQAADELSQAFLQQQLGLDSASITRQVKALEADGLVRRRADPVDNRFTLVSLTDQGHKAVHTYIPLAVAFGEKLQEGCSAAEIAVANRMLEIIRVRALELVPPAKSTADPTTPTVPEEPVTD
jgi:DNA-binding MarR family transcriptional regulator